MKIDELLPEEIFALTIWGEARGETIEGQIAVGNVIHNRLKSGKYRNYKEVCLAPKQFSCWNEDDPNLKKMLAFADQFKDSKPSDRLLRQLLWLARGFRDDWVKDNTRMALNYITWSLFNSDKRPNWAKNVTKYIKIGNHVFFTAP